MRYEFAYAIEVFLRTLFSEYATFEGRVSRRDFWHYMSAAAAATAVSHLPGLVLPVLGVASILAPLALAAPSLGMAVRRMHDVTCSGWWLAAPIANLVLACQPGRVGPNMFGRDPQGAKIEAFA